MMLLQDLIKKIDDQTPRQQIIAEVDKLSKQKKTKKVRSDFRWVFVPLYDDLFTRILNFVGAGHITVRAY